MPDWEWWFASEWGRDRILRERVESLQYEASSASASSARMRSQLARLEGSLETRLNALSAAFDAYVELGDVREQLTAHADTGAIRRRVRDAFKIMTEGGQPEPVGLDDPADKDGQSGYWLGPAADAVIAINAGRRDTRAEQLAEQRLPEARLFVVAAAGALGHGSAVAEVVPSLFVDATVLSTAQRSLFRAVVTGLYPEVLAQLQDRFAAALADVEVTETLAWITDQARTADARDQLAWVEQAFSPAGVSAPVEPAPLPDRPDAAPSDGVDLRAPEAVVRDGLRAIVVEMIEAGTGDEADLLRRARVLRARIENPGSPDARADEERPAPTTAAADAVREELVDPNADPAVRQELADWLRPGVLAAVDALGTPPERSEPVVTVRTPGGTLDVTPSGPDLQRQAQVMANLTTEDPSVRTKLIAAVAATGVLAVVALLTAVLDQVGIAVVLLIAAIATAVAAGRILYGRSVRRREQGDDVANAQQGIANATRQAREQQQVVQASDAALQQAHVRVRGQVERVAV